MHYPGREVDIRAAVAAAVEAAELLGKPVVLHELYGSVEQATSMHNGRLAGVFRRAVQEALEECRAAGRLSPHACGS